MDKRLIVIDGNSVIYRAFYALPPMNNGAGLETNAVFGFTSMLIKMITDYRPSHICVAFDKSNKTFRNRDFEDYKAGRKKTPPELKMQFDPMKSLLDALKIERFEIDDYEADDIIGTISKSAEEDGFEVLVVTGDRDAIQLASDRTTIVFTKRGITEIEEYTPETIMEKYSVTPSEFIDLKGLMGDKSDNIPGVPGVGEKTGIKLIKKYGSVENVLDNIHELKGAMKKKMEENADLAVLSKKLATIVRDVPIEFNLDEMVFGDYSKKEVVEKFKEFRFNTLLTRFLALDKELFGSDEVEIAGEVPNLIEIAMMAEKEEKNRPVENGDVEELIAGAEKNGYIYLKSAVRKGNILDRNIIKMYISADGQEVYSFDGSNIESIKSILEDEKIKKYGYSMKEDYLALLPYGIKMRNMNFDMEIAEYLIDSKSQTAYAHNAIAEKYLYQSIMSEEDLLGKGVKKIGFEDVEPEKLDEYFLTILQVTASVKEEMLDKIAQTQMFDLFNDIEMPLIEVLGDMEYWGIKADAEILEKLGDEFSESIATLENKIYEYAGKEFNINSPKQLGTVLFEDLKLPVIKKTKTGYSTNAEVLEKLEEKHPIIRKISEYRTVSKLNSTYVEGLKPLINEKDGRIHSNFKQTITTTGRISSTDPNMQNIPVRMELGRKLRGVFVSEEGKKLIDADYSQVELRVLAHMSGDEHMIEAFRNGEDIHATTAAKVFGVSPDEVTGEMRSAAKAVNFGIIYGKTSFGLSKDLEISLDDAKRYIESYFEKYPSIKSFMDKIVADAEKTGYVETLLHRRRYIPEIMSKRFMDKNRGQRAAMNAPIQGSAADIIKIAMVNVHKRLEKENMNARLILQVHDELIVEAELDEIEKASQILREEMENALNLDVNLDVDLNVGNSWYETK